MGLHLAPYLPLQHGDIILLGAPGAGKGTLARLLQSKHPHRHLSTGDLLRKADSRSFSLDREIAALIDKGEFVPDEMIIRMINVNVADYRDVVYDGFPRNVNQAKLLDELNVQRSRKIHRVIKLEVGFTLLMQRLKGRRTCPVCHRIYHVITLRPQRAGLCDRCGERLKVRKDDHPSVIAKRLDLYEEQTEPLVKYYTDRNLFSWVDGDGSPEEVYARVRPLLTT